MVSNTIPSPSNEGEVSNKPKPLVFPDANTPAANSITMAKDKPKPLMFDEPKKEQSAPAPRALSFGSGEENRSPPVVTTPKPQALFGDKPCALEQRAIDFAVANFQIGNSIESVKAQIRQLIPLTLLGVMKWGASQLQQETELADVIAKMTSKLASLRVNELCEEALASVSPPTKEKNDGFLGKIFKTIAPGIVELPFKTPEEYKQKLEKRLEKLQKMLPRYEELTAECARSEHRLTITLAAISSVATETHSSDDAINTAVEERRRLLLQAAQQAKFLSVQLAESRKIVVSQIARIEQLVSITFRAYDQVNASKKSKK